MSSESETWESLKTQYLNQIEKALSSVEHPRRKEVLDDVRSHLEQRFAELAPEQRTWENFQAIIIEMGPACDYAELLGENTITPHAETGIWRRFVVNAALSITIIATIIVLCQILDRLVMPYYGKLVATSQPAHPDGFVVKTCMTLQGRYIDNIKYPFVDDPNVIGKWVSVDFVRNPEDFIPGQQRWRWGSLYLKEIQFFKGGTTNWAWQWTKGLLLHSGDHTASHYTIKTIDGKQYMFFEWKSGDYVILHRKPAWYVLVKADDKGDATITQAAESTPHSK